MKNMKNLIDTKDKDFTLNRNKNKFYKSKKYNNYIKSKSNNNNSIRVLYKKVNKIPVVKIINLQKLKKAIVNKKLEIIAYDTVYIIYDKNLSYTANIILPLRTVTGDLILTGIDKKNREFKGLSQEDVIWYSKDLMNKSNIANKKITTKSNIEKTSKVSELNNTTDFEKELLSRILNVELVLTNLIRKEGVKND